MACADIRPARVRSGLLAVLLAGAATIVAAQVDPSPTRIAPEPSVPALPTAEQAPAGRWTAQQLRQGFAQADADGNDELTRAEAQRLAVLPRSFEQLDDNNDGVLSRAEYEALLR